MNLSDLKDTKLLTEIEAEKSNSVAIISMSNINKAKRRSVIDKYNELLVKQKDDGVKFDVQQGKKKKPKTSRREGKRANDKILAEKKKLVEALMGRKSHGNIRTKNLDIVDSMADEYRALAQKLKGSFQIDESRINLSNRSNEAQVDDKIPYSEYLHHLFKSQSEYEMLNYLKDMSYPKHSTKPITINVDIVKNSPKKADSSYNGSSTQKYKLLNPPYNVFINKSSKQLFPEYTEHIKQKNKDSFLTESHMFASPVMRTAFSKPKSCHKICEYVRSKQGKHERIEKQQATNIFKSINTYGDSSIDNRCYQESKLPKNEDIQLPKVYHIAKTSKRMFPRDEKKKK